MRHRVEQLYDALDAKLTDHARFILQDQLDAFAEAEARVARYDAFIRDRLAPWEEQVQLLTTIPGISEDSARAILIEPGPDYPSIRLRAALCRLGRTLPRQQRKCWQATFLEGAKGQLLPALRSRRVCPRGCQNR